MTEYERIRKEAVREIKHILELPSDEYSLIQCTNMLVDRILSLSGIEIRAENQDLPEPSNRIAPNYFEEVLEARICRQAQQDMLKAGFVKVIPKESIGGEYGSKRYCDKDK